MKKVLRKLRVRNKLFVLVMVPLLGMTYFGVSAALAKRSEVSEAKDLAVIADFGVQVGELLDQTHLERNANNIYISSYGTLYRDELEAQQAQTDVAVGELVAFLDENLASLPAEIQAQQAEIDIALADLADSREKTLNLAETVKASGEHFTSLNTHLLSAVASIASASSNAELQQRAVAYVAFLNAKEALGLERALLTSVFEDDRFIEDQFAQLSGYLAAHDSYMDVFSGIATDDVLESYAQIMGDPAIAEAEAMEITASQSLFASMGIDEEIWFATATSRIDLLKEAEEFQTTALLDRAADIESSATMVFRLTMLLLLVVIVFTVFVSRYVIAAILDPLRAVSAQADRVQSGDLRIQKINSDGTDELAELSHTFDAMTETLILLGAQAHAIGAGNLSEEVLSISSPGELGENFTQMIESLRTLSAQAEAISAGALEDEVLSEQLPGELGVAFLEMVRIVRLVGVQAALIGSGDLSSETLSEPLPGELGVCFTQMIQSLISMLEQSKAISAGSLDAEVLDHSLPGEVGAAYSEMVHIVRLVGEQVMVVGTGELSSSALDERLPGSLGDAFDAMISSLREIASRLGGASGHLVELSDAMSSAAAHSAEKASGVSDTGASVNAEMESIAAAVEEMNASISGVAENARIAASIVAEAVGKTNQTQEIVDRLGASGARISSIVAVISNISEETNLLALNAAIEAARAGDAGRGFAVVASEVKALAEESKRSATEISDQVSEVQQGCDDAAGSMGSIGEVMERLEQIALIISESMDAQEDTNAEIENSVNGTVDKIQEIAVAAHDMEASAAETRQASSETKESTEDLLRLANTFR